MWPNLSSKRHATPHLALGLGAEARVEPVGQQAGHAKGGPTSASAQDRRRTGRRRSGAPAGDRRLFRLYFVILSRMAEWRFWYTSETIWPPIPRRHAAFRRAIPTSY